MFYISSQGHSASTWLAQMLNSHPMIICWHGTRSIPPYGSGTNDIPIEDFVSGLLQCEDNTRNQKQFGACHGFYGTIAKSAVEKNDGLFLAIARHPIRRVQSIMSATIGYFLSMYTLPSDTEIDLSYYFNDVFFNSANIKYANTFNARLRDYYQKDNGKLGLGRTVLRRLHLHGQTILRNNISTMILRKLQIDRENGLTHISHPNPAILTAQIIVCFDCACRRTFLTDSEIFNECEEKQILKMEEMVISREYFDKSIFFPIMGEKANSSYLDRVFEEKEHFTKHAPSTHSKTELGIFEDWPRILQDTFLDFLHKSSAIDLYRRYDYDLPS